MKLCWTKSNLPLSLLIRAITGEDCSHFMFVFESQASGLLFQSNLLGTSTKFFNTEKNTSGFTIVHEIDLPMSAEEDKAWDIIVQKYDSVGYNFLGALYLGWRIFLFRILKSPIPKRNKWNQHGAMFCDQVYDVLNKMKDPRIPKINVMNGMDTPHMVYEKVVA